MAFGRELCSAVLLILVASVAAFPYKHFPGSDGGDHWNTEANRFFHSIPKEERKPFLLTSIALGIMNHWPAVGYLLRYPAPKIPQDLNVPEDLFDKFKNMTVPESFHENLVEWMMVRFSATPRQVFQFCLHDLICTPDNTCFDPGDVDDLCCPF